MAWLNASAMLATAAMLLCGCATGQGQSATDPAPQKNAAAIDPFWANATVYFLMTDRFANGDPSNDTSVGRQHDGDALRSFEGGDLKGLTQRIEQGYFDALGVDAIWTTPLIENVHGSVVEGEWGKTYAYHGYWPKDWTRVDPNFGDEADFARMVAAAHAHGIRVIVDVIANHSGPQTPVDAGWGDDWVRVQPPCDYKSFAGTTSCELAATLPDIRTDKTEPVALPAFLVEKWRSEGRFERETAELDAFFMRTGYPRTPRYYLVKWLTDWVRDYGVDGFRVDTAKHTDPEVWDAVKQEAVRALAYWRSRHPKRLAGDKPFYMVGEVFNFGFGNFGNAVGDRYNYGDRQVRFFDHGFDALINMGFPTQMRTLNRQALFAANNAALQTGDFRGVGMLNYLASHDDMAPYDPQRKNAFAAAETLLLAPGAAQIYYGDEVGRSLIVPGTKGDPTLRSVFDWSAVAAKADLLDHWRRLGRFRQAHRAIGAGVHRELSAAPYVFSRTLGDDRVVVALDVTPGSIDIPVGDVFAEGARVRDGYSGGAATVSGGAVHLASAGRVVLLARE